MIVHKRGFIKKISFGLLLIIVLFIVYQIIKVPPLTRDWQTHLAIPSTAIFDGDLVTIKNVRDFRYGPEEKDQHPHYYDKTYNLSQIKKIWYTTEPFNENPSTAHTYLSFEFTNGDFLVITIEARKAKGQNYSIWKGMLRSYPLMYIAADERDVTLLRANLRKDNVYIYPVKTGDEKAAETILTNMLNEMNNLLIHPRWYNSIFSNCTSEIAKQVNLLSPGRISPLSWQLLFTASADKLALKHGLLDTDLTIDEARQKYLITEKSQKIGDVPDYSRLIRE